jgi:hypothetical protein
MTVSKASQEWIERLLAKAEYYGFHGGDDELDNKDSFEALPIGLQLDSAVKWSITIWGGHLVVATLGELAARALGYQAPLTPSQSEEALRLADKLLWDAMNTAGNKFNYDKRAQLYRVGLKEPTDDAKA